MSTTTIEQPGVQKLDPDATYTQPGLAAALGMTDRQLRRWRKDKRMRFPRPFFQGRMPCWRGHVVIAWQDRQQEQA